MTIEGEFDKQLSNCQGNVNYTGLWWEVHVQWRWKFNHYSSCCSKWFLILKNNDELKSSWALHLSHNMCSWQRGTPQHIWPAYCALVVFNSLLRTSIFQPKASTTLLLKLTRCKEKMMGHLKPGKWPAHSGGLRSAGGGKPLGIRGM